MKTTKLFFMAALALMTAACSNEDNELLNPDQQPQKVKGITITAQLAPKTDGATTRAVADGGDKITVTWAENEHIAILYEVSSTKYVADATITAVDGSGAATITFTVEAGTANDTPCTLVYPLSAAKDDHTGVKDNITLLTAQDGTLNANLDVRVGAGTIQTTTPGLTVTTQPEAQFAIFKFTVKNSDASATIDVKPLTITIGAQDYVITPASATSELFVALPAISGEAVSFTATGSDSKTYTASKASVTFTAGKYYQSVIKMAEAAPALNLTSPAVGQVIGDDGKNYDYASLPGGVTAVAKICYVSGSNGLALALTDEGTMNWSTAGTTCAAHTPAFTGGTWKLATKDEWNNMISGAGGFEALRDGFSSVGGTNMKSDGGYTYWSSTEYDAGQAWDYYFEFGYWSWDDKVDSEYARACLAFSFTPAPAYTLLSAATTADYGKVVCAAGHLHDAKTAVPVGCTAVGILGKVTETGHGLILSLQNATNQNWNTINGWTSETTYAGTTLKVLPDDAARGSLTSYTTLGETTVSNWAVAQKSDYEAIFTNLGSTTGDEDGKTYDANVNAYITTGVGGTAISNDNWSATERDGSNAWRCNSSLWASYSKTNSRRVRPVLAF